MTSTQGTPQRLQAPRRVNPSRWIWLLPPLSGLLLAVSFPPSGMGFLGWLALAPLIVFAARVGRARTAFLGGFAAGLVQFFSLLTWIPAVLHHYGGLPAAAAWGIFVLLPAMLACFPATLCAFTRFCMNRGGERWLWAFAPASVALEFLRSHFPFGGFPWLLLGYSQTGSLRFMQIADIVGVYGVGCVLAAGNTALAWLWLRRQRPSRGAIPLAVVALITAGCYGYGTAALARWDQIVPGRTAALLQGNLSLDDNEAELAWKYREGYLQLANHLDAPGADLLILPESPAPMFYQYDEAYRETLRSLARRAALGLVFNNVSFREVGGSQEYFNSAFFLDRQGNETGRYDKIHLVPFGEYVPLSAIFFFSRSISRDVGAFQAGAGARTIGLGGHPVNAIICFEAIFPDLVRRFVRQGSQLIINLTNDGWYGATSAPYQHLAMARWRAVECRRFLLRAANSGISAVVAPTGRLEVQTGLLRREAAVGRFAFLEGETPYVRYGGYFPILCVILSLLAGIGCGLRGRGGPANEFMTGRRRME